MATYEEVEAARPKLKALLPERPRMGIGVGRGEQGGLVLSVHVQASSVPEGLPHEVDGVPVKYQAVGRIVAQ